MIPAKPFMMRRYQIAPFPKPRPRSGIASNGARVTYVPNAYKRWKADCVKLGMRISPQPLFIFHIAMPSSWSKSKRLAFDGNPHTQIPDLDNLVKAVLDACLEDDSQVWIFCASKIWGVEAAIEIGEGVPAFWEVG